ncbi:hypothetical protein SAMN04489716_9080 [Actinoplanes derwentensis]|uniref:Uncharacterized protein n=1 Tax=Actinoplanes derwentensis TaxID=113562 RepID=A0A1H2DBN8_9ACTN|nr:hypothetical protein SAMN04489716_9080 [Actinoplanes derwentensis]
MNPTSLITLVDEHLALARQASSGRSAYTVYGAMPAPCARRS